MSKVADRAHFYSLAAPAMGQVLLDHLRAKQAIKRGGNVAHVEFTSEPLASDDYTLDHFALGQALGALRRMDPARLTWSSCPSTPDSIFSKLPSYSISATRPRAVTGIAHRHICLCNCRQASGKNAQDLGQDLWKHE